MRVTPVVLYWFQYNFTFHLYGLDYTCLSACSLNWPTVGACPGTLGVTRGVTGTVTIVTGASGPV